MKIKTLICCCVLFICQNANSTHWVHTGVVGADNDNTRAIYIDLDNLSKHKFLNQKGYYVTAWTKTIYKQPEVFNGRAYIDATIFKYYDCVNKKYNITDMYYFNQIGTPVHGEKISISTDSSKKWYSAPPNSLGDLELIQVCSFYNKYHKK